MKDLTSTGKPATDVSSKSVTSKIAQCGDALVYRDLSLSQSVLPIRPSLIKLEYEVLCGEYFCLIFITYLLTVLYLSSFAGLYYVLWLCCSQRTGCRPVTSASCLLSARCVNQSILSTVSLS